MPISSDPPRARSRHRRRHADAVIQAEVRRLARALAPLRVLQRDALVLQRDALRQAARADAWHDDGFDRALSAAVETGEIKRLHAPDRMG
jgi:hypothetical protein